MMVFVYDGSLTDEMRAHDSLALEIILDSYKAWARESTADNLLSLLDIISKAKSAKDSSA